MSIDPSDLIQASQSLYEASSGLNVPSTYIPTTSAGSVGFMVMSYPGRPPMGPMQGMPPMPYMQLGGPPPLMQAMPMSMQQHHMLGGGPPMSAPPVRYRPPQTQHQAPPSYQGKQRQAPEPQGPPVTVFVGNITERAPDAMIRHILAACGHVVSWKRVQAFGFCEFGSPDAGLRAIRVLHDMDLGGKKLVVKVDAKTKTVLDEYKEERRKKMRGQSPLQDETPDEDDYMDEGMKQSDRMARDRILLALEDYEPDMNNFTESLVKSERAKAENKDRKMSRTQEKLLKLSQGEGGPNDMILDDVDIEEGKRDLITREIGKFREIMKKQEEEKEVERRRRDREREERETRSPSPPAPRSPPTSRSPSLESAYSNKIRSKGRDRPRRSHSRERDRDRERDGHRERDRDRDRDREREDAIKKTEREVHREKEMEEEAKERKKSERKARDKEAAYQERLRNWEGRERRRRKEVAKERERDEEREKEREKDAKRLKEFLEDYDDERDDAKYYKGRELQRRLAERKKEIELDARDRQKEKEELEELRAKIFAEDHHDPNLEFERLKQEVEAQYKPKLLINVSQEQSRHRDRLRVEEEVIELAKTPPSANHKHSEPSPANHKRGGRDSDHGETPSSNHKRGSRDSDHGEPPSTSHKRGRDSDQPPANHKRVRDDVDGTSSKRGREMSEHAESPPVNHHQSSRRSRDSAEPHKRARDASAERDEIMPLEVAEEVSALPQTEMIESDEEDQRSPSPPPPMPSPEDDNSQVSATSSALDDGKPSVVMTWHSPQQGGSQPAGAGGGAKKKKLDMKEVFNTDDDEDSGLGAGKKRKLVPLDYGEEKKKAGAGGGGDTGKSQEEKRKHIKTLIDKIPTDKTALFAFTLDWSAVDNQLMERRIRPWINKKIIEYIGEPEPTLVDFICSKVLAGSAPQGILDDVQMVLDEEAEVFVVKMWRLLIYEIEAKKLGLVK